MHNEVLNSASDETESREVPCMVRLDNDYLTAKMLLLSNVELASTQEMMVWKIQIVFGQRNHLF
jgi:hypothetical protein